MIEDDSLLLPNKRTTTVDHAQRVHTELVSQTAARQNHEQQQATTGGNISRRERMCLYLSD